MKTFHLLVSSLLSVHTALALSTHFKHHNFTSACASVLSHLDIENATVYFSQFVAGGANLSLPENNVTCGQPSHVVPVDMCRVALYVATSERSGVNMETWLPANWTGRYLSSGNGGINGCLDYDVMAYGLQYGFATAGSNNGHNGTSGEPLLNNADSVKDFAWRALHTSTVVGKQVTDTFYGKAHSKSYYLGCSTGGRQGFKMAQDFAEDFDGIVAGAPAVAFNNLTSWSGHFLPITGVAGSKTFVSTDMWSIIHQDILRQCDKLDGYADGIIEDPLLCNYTGTSLLCSANATTNCLTAAQQNTVQQIFSPMYLEDGSFVYPRMQPGSEEVAKYVLYSGGVFPYTADWFKYALYNNASWDPTTISNQDYINAITVNPGDIQSFKGDLSGMRKRGSKILHYHGQMDGIISSEISPLYYNHVKETMGLTECQLDEFYRFFRISGTGHCTGGDGASVFGNTWGSVESNNPAENVLLAIVDWVENKKAPETVIGTRWVDGVKSKGVDYKRAHCKFPKSNKYKGEGDPKAIDSWQCV